MISKPVISLVNPTVAIIGIGSNLGDPKRNVELAFEAIRRLTTGPLIVSSLWRTPPEGCAPGTPDFINAVVALVPLPEETPLSLMRKLRLIELEFGRPLFRKKNQPRTLDLDLIAYGNEVMVSDELILPHPAAHKRRFVLGPLSEIGPELVLPGQTKTVLELWNQL